MVCVVFQMPARLEPCLGCAYLLLARVGSLLNGWSSRVLLAGIGQALKILHINLIRPQSCSAIYAKVSNKGVSLNNGD